MKTKAARYQVGIITDSPQALTGILDLLNADMWFESAIQHPEALSPFLENRTWDAILYCNLSGEQSAALVDVVGQIQPHAPVIVLLDHPTVKQGGAQTQ
jgi:hypothetical protein